MPPGGDLQMNELHPREPSSIRVGANQPLIGVIEQENGREVVRYFTDERELDQHSRQHSIQRALNLAVAWNDLDWDEMEQALDRIRHESTPTPPIEEL
jgi:hypothetical protein